MEPHPHSPVLAVSGLDHSIKICTPYSTKPMDTEHLKEVLVREKERKDEDIGERKSLPYSWFISCFTIYIDINKNFSGFEPA